MGRVVVQLYDDVPVGAARFADLAQGKQGVGFRRTKFDAVNQVGSHTTTPVPNGRSALVGHPAALQLLLFYACPDCCLCALRACDSTCMALHHRSTSGMQGCGASTLAASRRRQLPAATVSADG